MKIWKWPQKKGLEENKVRKPLPLRHFLALKTVLVRKNDRYNTGHYPIHHTSPTHSYMESIRQKQVGELIRRYFGMILTEEGSYIYGRDKLVTLTDVKMTPDLLVAKIYISVYGTENKQEVILELEDNQTRLRQALARKIGKQMRRMPEIAFFLDDTVDEMYRVQDLLNRVEEADKKIGQ